MVLFLFPSDFWFHLPLMIFATSSFNFCPRFTNDYVFISNWYMLLSLNSFSLQFQVISALVSKYYMFLSPYEFWFHLQFISTFITTLVLHYSPFISKWFLPIIVFTLILQIMSALIPNWFLLSSLKLFFLLSSKDFCSLVQQISSLLFKIFLILSLIDILLYL